MTVLFITPPVKHAGSQLAVQHRSISTTTFTEYAVHLLSSTTSTRTTSYVCGSESGGAKDSTHARNRIEYNDAAGRGRSDPNLSKLFNNFYCAARKILFYPAIFSSKTVGLALILLLLHPFLVPLTLSTTLLQHRRALSYFTYSGACGCYRLLHLGRGWKIYETIFSCVLDQSTYLMLLVLLF